MEFPDLNDALSFVFRRDPLPSLELNSNSRQLIEESHRQLKRWIATGQPLYGVTTGFGKSCSRVIDSQDVETLQMNLVRYLTCGTGAPIPREAARAMCLFRYHSLARGLSGVSLELMDRMKLFLERDWIPVVPCEGSLGASGDLIPLAYLARILQGEGQVDLGNELLPASALLKRENLNPYILKPKEGLALVNGTSAMAGQCLVNWNLASTLADLAIVATSWSVLILESPIEAYGTLVNSDAKKHSGQGLVANSIRALLASEAYAPAPGHARKIVNNTTDGLIQERYSLRCVPQILGPVVETLQLTRQWLTEELHGVSDNPLFSPDGTMAMGGNFYGGYLAHSMDYLKICLGNVADLIDRQIMNLFDERTHNQLPPNLAPWGTMPERERHLNHGLKACHQSISAMTSEILSKAMPNTIFSRSSESHNQDKVSLGMSAAMQCHYQLEQLTTVMSLAFTCLAQALDIREIELKGDVSRALYDLVRTHVPTVERDTPLDESVMRLSKGLKIFSHAKGAFL